MIDKKILIQNIEKTSEKLEELIRRQDSGVFFGASGIGNISGKDGGDNMGYYTFQFYPESNIVERGYAVFGGGSDVDSTLKENSTNENWCGAGKNLPSFQKKVLEKITNEFILRAVKQNIRGLTRDDEYQNRGKIEFSKYFGDGRGGCSYTIGIKVRLLSSLYSQSERAFLDQVIDSKDEDFIELMDKIADIFIPKYNQAIKGWEEYFKR